MNFLTKTVLSIAGVALFCSIMGIGVNDGGFDVTNSEPVNTSNQIVDCISKPKQCSNTTPEFTIFGLKIGK